MKRHVLLMVVLFSILLTVGCRNKNEISQSDVNKLTPIPTKVIAEDKLKENINTGNNTKTQSKAQNDTDYNMHDISPFIPTGWHILQTRDGELAIAEGDLNKDRISDKAFVVEESTQSDSPRNLIIIFGNKDNTYTLSIKTEKAVLYAYEGGGFGDPFDDIRVDRGSVLLKFFGGSGESGYKKYRFGYLNNGWYLIGATEGSFVSIDNKLENIEEDYNLLTGDYIFKQFEDGKIMTSKSNRGIRKLLNLQNFDVHTELEPQF